jgi:hypothetical protein
MRCYGGLRGESSDRRAWNCRQDAVLGSLVKRNHLQRNRPGAVLMLVLHSVTTQAYSIVPNCVHPAMLLSFLPVRPHRLSPAFQPGWPAVRTPYPSVPSMNTPQP